MNVKPVRHITLSILFLVFHLMLSEKIQAQTLAMPEWEQAVPLPEWEGRENPGLAGMLSGFHAGILIMAGGANFPYAYPWQGGSKRYHQSIYLWQPGQEQKPGCFIQQSILLPEPMAYAGCVSTSQGVVCAGGENAKGLSKRVYLLRLHQKNKKIQVTELPELPIALSNAMLAEVDGKLYLAGGESATGTSHNLYIFSWQDSAKGWQQGESLPAPVANGIWLADKHAQADRIWLLGGRARQAHGITAFSDQVFCYDVKTRKWLRKASLPYPLAAGTGVLYDNNHILLLGGDKGHLYNQTEELIRQEKDASGEEAKALVKLEKNKLQEGHPGFSREILRYDIARDQWTQSGVLPFATPVTTQAHIQQNRIYLPSGEIRAGVRSPFIRIAKIPVTNE